MKRLILLLALSVALLAVEQAGVMQLLQVVRHGRLREVERAGELASAHLTARSCECVDDAHPRGITERAKDRGSRLGLLVGERRRGQRCAARNRFDD